MKLLKLKTIASLLPPVWLFYFAVTRLPRGFRDVLFEPLIWKHWKVIQPDWQLRLLTFGLLMSALAAGYLFLRWFLRGRLSLTPVPFVFGFLGLGLLLALSAAFLAMQTQAFTVGAGLTKVLLVLPLLIGIFFLRKTNVPVRRQVSASRAVLVAAWVAGLLLVNRVLWYAAYNVLVKIQAGWDEAVFWWPATEYMHRLGLSAYIRSFAVAFYDPAYPLFTSALLAGFPKNALLQAAGNFCAFSFGLATVLFLVENSLKTARAAATVLLLIVSYFALVCVHGGWIPALQWIPGNGDGAATLACLLLFWLPSSFRATDARWIKIALGLGIGAFVGTIKPPLSFLWLPAILTLLVGEWWGRSSGRRPLRSYTVLFSLFAGAFCGKKLWAALLVIAGRNAYYQLDISALFSFQLTETNYLALRLLWTDYRLPMVFFTGCAALALLRPKQRKWIPELLVCLGLIAAILLLYLTQWKHTEHESAGRYMSQGMLAWVWFFLLKEGRIFFATARILGKKRPPKRELLGGQAGA